MTTQQPSNPTTATTANPSPPTSTTDSEMSLRATTLITNLSAVTARIAAASAKAPQTQPQRPRHPVRLLAVSKIKPASDVQIIHEHNPALHFGENYFQELLEKSRALKALSPEVRWHFIGGLQSNKCVSLARDVPGLFAVESVDTEKKANLLNRGWGERLAAAAAAATGGDADAENRLRVYVQVNTSGEANKSGVEPAEATRLCRHIRENCPRLKLVGLMTIGALARSQATTLENENEDFLCLRETRDRVEKELGLSGGDGEGLELSMGMTQDYEGAIKMGSDQVRVGAEIFGPRPPKLEAKVVGREQS
ncbi:YggS family pyridoxal phosphate enzyme [Blastomyces percursus]|uniref:Pyridoxal phosphate homeostasis protein n=1 Tax=Blastomyces percursus TaxID=1658174 RepID=A0A1J9R6C8_9EURO|nr:YggS family pyridoxal phosphate enzyme [Blastomyces percursus]